MLLTGTIPSILAACVLAPAIALCAGACSREQVRDFAWTDASGRALPFVRDAEGAYTPRKAVAVPADRRLAVSFRVEVDTLPLEVSLRAPGASRQAAERHAFLAEKGDFTAYLPAPAPGSVAWLGIAFAGQGAAAAAAAAGSSAGSAAKTAAAAPPARITGIAVVPFYSGFGRSDGRLRISSDFSPVEGGASLSVAAGPGATGISLEFSGRSDRDIAIADDRGTRYLLKARSPSGRAVLARSMFAADAARIGAEFPPGIQPAGFNARVLSPEELELADLGRIAASDDRLVGPLAGDYALYRWDLLPDVLVFDFRDYATQDAYLKRLAFFVEKEGFRGKLAADGEIAPLHGWNAHDYRAQDLAAFFQAARKSSFPLGERERKLESLLLERGVLVKIPGGVGPGRGAIVSITRESESYLRTTFLTHESVHALFFADDDYRRFASDLWSSLDRAEKWFWVLYFDWMHYDVGSPYLMANEFQAYLLQQPVSRVEEYFTRTLPARVLETNPELGERIRAYMKEFGDRFAVRARELDAWVRAKYGFGAGRTYFLR